MDNPKEIRIILKDRFSGELIIYETSLMELTSNKAKFFHDKRQYEILGIDRAIGINAEDSSPIFENDFVKIKDYISGFIIRLVKFNDVDGESFLSANFCLYPAMAEEDVEIIGNTWFNPEIEEFVEY